MEAADSPATSSKVIVQCTDPHGLFERVLPNLQACQPLGNLHWKSNTRPLRSIDSLNVSFIREERQNDLPNSTRRHQIPGLRQTPFVKILLLRCDDKENYKDVARKDVKQWLKTQGISTDGKSSSKGQEGHDAFECIVLHVVLPNTPAAEQPKSSKHLTIDVNESTDSLNNKSKWTGKNSSTIYDRLRADFSSSSKASFERIAQVRLNDGASKPGALSVAESAELWQGFVDQLKAAILASFDLRVAQYEEDIRDRDAQRNLPGWNFCTFFILKEGLARGFENVGLLDDALTVYDELDAGLDGIVRAQSAQGEIDSAGALLLFSKDLKPAIRSAINDAQNDEPDVDDRSSEADLSILVILEQTNFPFDIAKYDYQQRILTNQVSALDLRTYIFTRKLHLLFRKSRNTFLPGKAKSRNSQSEVQYDVNRIAHILETALEFISFGARALYHDLYAAWGGREGLSDEELATQEQVIGNLVASWKFSALVQVLHNCHLSALLPETLAVRPDWAFASNGHNSSDQAPQTDATADEASTKSPLSTSQTDGSRDGRRQSMMVSLQQASQQHPSIVQQDPRERLALWTAELLIRVRATISEIDPTPGRICKLKHSAKLKTRDGQRILPDGAVYNRAGLQSASLKLVSSSTTFCLSLFKLLTYLAYQSYTFARQSQASKQLLLNLAELELFEGNFSQALSWLECISGLLDLVVRTVIDLSVLPVYQRVLRELKQPQKLAKCLISILEACSSGMSIAAVTSVGIDVQSVLDELISVSTEAEAQTRPFEQLFILHDIDRTIRHGDLPDGFSFSLSLSLKLRSILTIGQEMSLTLLAAEQSEPKSITLRSQTPVVLSTRATSVRFVSTTMTYGWYDFDMLSLKIGNIEYRHELKSGVATESSRRFMSMLSSPIMLYPRAGALSVKIDAAPLVDLTEPRRMRVTVGGNDTLIQDVTMKLKPATAGCRLNVQATELHDGAVEGFEIVQVDNTNAIRWRQLPPGKAMVIEVPYAMENTMLSLMDVRFTISYRSGKDVFDAFYLESLNPILPVTVNVQDIFQRDAFFSRFTASSATIVPVKIIEWQIEDNDAFAVQNCGSRQNPVMTFPRLPTSWVAQIRKKAQRKDQNDRMPLAVHYQCLDDLILHVIGEHFVADLNEPLTFASSLLIRHLNRQIVRLWREAELEETALLDELRLWTYEEMDWDTLLRGLSVQMRQSAEEWLRSWHQRHEHIDLQGARGPVRMLRLLVDMPQPSLIVSTQYRFATSNASHVTAGQPLKAEIIVQCDRHTTDALEVQYEVSGSSEMWLVGGRKRGILTTSMHEVASTLLLVAQRTGYLLLPSIEIRVRRAAESDISPVPSFEVEHKSQAQSIMVMPALQSTTIALSAASANGGYVVTDTRHR